MQTIKEKKNPKNKNKRVRAKKINKENIAPNDWTNILQISNPTKNDLERIWKILLTAWTVKDKRILQDGSLIYANTEKNKKEKSHSFNDPIKLDDLQEILLKKRAEKTKDDQKNRTRENAEVFTPLWVCNKQNDLVDQDWFDKKEGLFLTGNKTKFNNFLKNKHWEDFQPYVLLPRMEITCGEAPYLVSRYDVTDSNVKPNSINGRVGLLDRKLRIINHFIKKENKAAWEEWVIKAFQSIYGFEYQGDNLLLARINLFNTFCDYYKDKFGKNPSVEEEKELIDKIADIISWNLWQMDGINYCIPQNDQIGKKNPIENKNPTTEDIGKLYGSNQNQQNQNNSLLYCIIKDWTIKEKLEDSSKDNSKQNLQNILYFENFGNSRIFKSDDLKHLGDLLPVNPSDNN